MCVCVCVCVCVTEANKEKVKSHTLLRHSAPKFCAKNWKQQTLSTEVNFKFFVDKNKFK